MNYKYITKNNLEEKQNYMYSEYGGKEFLEKYQESRKAVIMDLCEEDTTEKLADLLLDIPLLLSDGKIKFSLDKLVQSFEVRKRIYNRTDILWKPITPEDGYEIYENYVLFGEILVQAYLITHNLKYFNCLLKLDDTLISILDEMDVCQRKRISVILNKEQLFYSKLRNEEVEA